MGRRWLGFTKGFAFIIFQNFSQRLFSFTWIHESKEGKFLEFKLDPDVVTKGTTRTPPSNLSVSVSLSFTFVSV